MNELEKIFIQLLSEDDQYTKEQIDKAWGFADVGNLVDAEIQFAKAAVCDPSNAYSALNYCIFLIKTGSWVKAKKILKKVIKKERIRWKEELFKNYSGK